MSGRPGSARRLLELPTLDLAAALLGWRLVRDDPAGRRVARIVELEAYIGEADRASHARFGRTARNEVMYGPPGRAYVYLVYGMHDCLNIVTEPAGSPAALLVRAVEPLEGEARMRAAIARRRIERRRRPVAATRPGTGAEAGRPPRAVATSRIASGPGLVCAAFDLDRTLTGGNLFDPASDVRIEPPTGEAPAVIATGPRVGIDYAGEPWTTVPWRFAMAANPAVSRPSLDLPADSGPGPATRQSTRPA